VRAHRRDRHGFTLIEIIASITIMSILAAVTLPRMVAAQPFSERGYADGIAASLRQSRAVALASGCDVQFNIDATGYRAFQRVPATSAGVTTCAASGAWTTPVQRGNGQSLLELQPSGVTLAVNRQFVFAADGTVAGAPVNITLGPQVITVDASGVVQGP
jgi:prepilin-type N-terminal cleavage/methylation domain-containing protein